MVVEQETLADPIEASRVKQREEEAYSAGSAGSKGRAAAAAVAPRTRRRPPSRHARTVQGSEDGYGREMSKIVLTERRFYDACHRTAGRFRIEIGRASCRERV